MEHYYTNKANIFQDELFIIDEEAKHISKVLRKKTGEEIYVTDGDRNLYRAEIQSFDKRKISCRIIEKLYNVNEPEIRVSLYPALLKKPSRFEFIVEKATELGVISINPVITEHVINKSSDRTERWQLVALAAMKQSARCCLPGIAHPVKFDEALKLLPKDGLNLIADERQSTMSIEKLESKPGKKEVTLFIGPEGGFSQSEIELAKSSGCEIINLGPRKYRSETAAVAALAVILV
jgi:16S rRNA (uracil1498-N3)-methyltransferase